MGKILNKKETFEKYTKLSKRKPPIIMGIQDEPLQEAVQLALAEHYIDGFKDGSKKYKRFKRKYIENVKICEQLSKEIEELKKKNESLQEKQIASLNRFAMMDAIGEKLKKGDIK